MKRLALTCGTATGLLLLCAAISVGALILGFALRSNPCDHNRLAFDQAAWLAGDDATAMLGNLRDKILHVGDAREFVLALLGPPTETEATCLRYDTGCDTWFVVRFDANGLLSETIVHGY